MTTNSDSPASALPDFDPAVLVDLDLREDLRAGREPLARVLAQADALADGGVLHVRALFQPTPLFHVLAQRGFAHHCEAFADDDWSSWFWRSAAPPIRTTAMRSHAAAAPAGVLDLRLLPAPEPLVAILARTACSDAAFEVMLPFDAPMLASLLAEQGWQVTRVGGDDDGVRLRIAPGRAGE